LAAKKRRRTEEQAVDPAAKATANYTLFNQKITFDFLKAHLWTAADILRGSLDPASRLHQILLISILLYCYEQLSGWILKVEQMMMV
jgi:hypothetical protein